MDKSSTDANTIAALVGIADAIRGMSLAVDANGWTVLAVGSNKIFAKGFSTSFSSAGPSVMSLTPLNGVGGTSLPKGMNTVGNAFFFGSLAMNGNAYAVDWNFEMVSGSTNINVTWRSAVGAITQNGLFYVVMIQ